MTYTPMDPIGKTNLMLDLTATFLAWLRSATKTLFFADLILGIMFSLFFRYFSIA